VKLFLCQSKTEKRECRLDESSSRHRCRPRITTAPATAPAAAAPTALPVPTLVTTPTARVSELGRGRGSCRGLRAPKTGALQVDGRDQEVAVAATMAPAAATAGAHACRRCLSRQPPRFPGLPSVAQGRRDGNNFLHRCDLTPRLALRRIVLPRRRLRRRHRRHLGGRHRQSRPRGRWRRNYGEGVEIEVVDVGFVAAVVAAVVVVDFINVGRLGGGLFSWAGAAS